MPPIQRPRKRAPIEYRVREVARYVERHEGMLPTAILVNIRDGARFDSEGDGRGNAETSGGSGTLGRRRPAPAQRTRGSCRAFRECVSPDSPLGYDVPVVFAVGLDRHEEMRLFHIVNSKTKSARPTLLRNSFIEL